MNINNEELLRIIQCLRHTLDEEKFYYEPSQMDEYPDYSKQIIDSIILKFLEYYLTPQNPSN